MSANEMEGMTLKWKRCSKFATKREQQSYLYTHSTHTCFSDSAAAVDLCER